VEVPFSRSSPAPGRRLWVGRYANGSQAPVAARGRTRGAHGTPMAPFLAIGKGTRQGTRSSAGPKQGSGKSTLFHVIHESRALLLGRSNRIITHRTQERRSSFKLLPPKKRLPHARVVAHRVPTASLRSSVLQRVDEELKRRGDIVPQLGRAGRGPATRARGRRHGSDGRRRPAIIDEVQEFSSRKGTRIATDGRSLLSIGNSCARAADLRHPRAG